MSEELHEAVNEHADNEPKLVVSARVYRILEMHGLITEPAEGKVMAKINEAGIQIAVEGAATEGVVNVDRNGDRLLDTSKMTIELVSTIQRSRGFMKAIGPDAEQIRQVLEINRFDHDMVPDLTDREFFKPCHKWNDARAWTPGGGAPRRRGRRRS